VWQMALTRGTITRAQSGAVRSCAVSWHCDCWTMQLLCSDGNRQLCLLKAHPACSLAATPVLTNTPAAAVGNSRCEAWQRCAPKLSADPGLYYTFASMLRAEVALRCAAQRWSQHIWYALMYIQSTQCDQSPWAEAPTCAHDHASPKHGHTEPIQHLRKQAKDTGS
jgi:hypothetical protein